MEIPRRRKKRSETASIKILRCSAAVTLRVNANKREAIFFLGLNVGTDLVARLCFSSTLLSLMVIAYVSMHGVCCACLTHENFVSPFIKITFFFV